MRAWRWGASAVLLATAAAAQDLGDGHLGDLVVDDLDVPNKVLALTQDVKAGDALLPVPATPAYYPSDLLMLIRVRGGTDLGNGAIQPSGAGDTFFTRISHVEIQGFDINPPLDRDWPSADTEIIYVPEYRNLTITSTGNLYAQTFDGTIGGVVALLVTNELRVDGTLHADGIGFRGGQAGINGANSGSGCSNPNQDTTGGAEKGEGILAVPWNNTSTGFGRNGNGGGGGVCQASGGGGGANAGKGGQGGASTDGLRPVGGQGGSPVMTDGFLPLFGGGGGAGTYDGTGSSGGAGGGIVIIRAGHISGSGLISARGGDALTGPAESPTSNGSPGGGGAGGSIDIVSVQSPTCHVSVKGGNGGLPAGGGGGGGRVRFSAPNSDGCTADLTAGLGASSSDKQAQPTSEQAAGYIGTLDVETLNPMTMMLPNRYEFGTLGCSSTGNALPALSLLALLFSRRREKVPRSGG